MMSQKPSYILGINTYDHDVSACLLRNGEIAFAIAKERITRLKHASGFYQEVIDYCLDAEGIRLDDVDLVVRNCYVLPVDDLERRLTSMEMPLYLSEPEREQAKHHPLFCAQSNKVVNISHHLAHAYSGFAACPFDEGVVMVVDGVGGYRADVMEQVPPGSDTVPLARESESYYRFSGSQLEPIKKVWLEPTRGFLSDEFYHMAGAWRGLQPRLDLRVRRLEQVRRADGACAVRPAERGQAFSRTRERRAENSAVARRVQSAVAC